MLLLAVMSPVIVALPNPAPVKVEPPELFAVSAKPVDEIVSVFPEGVIETFVPGASTTAPDRVLMVVAIPDAATVRVFPEGVIETLAPGASTTLPDSPLTVLTTPWGS